MEADDEIARVQREIEQVEQDIKKVEASLEGGDLTPEEKRYFWEEKKQLRDKEKLLREEKKQLREEKQQLREEKKQEKKQLRDKEKLLWEEKLDLKLKNDDDLRIKRQKFDEDQLDCMRIMVAQMRSLGRSATSVNSQHQVGEVIMKSHMWSLTLSEKELEFYLGDPVMNVNDMIEEVLSELQEPVWDTLAQRGLQKYNEIAAQNHYKPWTADDLKSKNGELNEKFVQLAIWYFCHLVKELCPGVTWNALDTSVLGIQGHGMKPDISFCRTTHASLPEMETILEIKPVHNLTNYADAVGQLKDRADALFLNQPGRSKAIMAYIAYKFFDLVVIEKYSVRHSGAVALNFEKGSTGLQLLVRMLLTRSENLGFISINPPFIPATPQGAKVTGLSLVFIAKPKLAVGEPDVDTEHPSPRGTKVYFCKHELQEIITDAVLKLGIVEKEVENLRKAQVIDGVIKLLDTGHCSDGEYLITYPRGQRLSDKMKAADISDAITQIAKTINNLYSNHRMLHRDISIGNIIWVKETRRAYLIDWATAAEEEDIQEYDQITGTPMFMSVHVLRNNKSNVSTDLESLLYVFMYIALAGRLPWRKKVLVNNRPRIDKSVKYCTMFEDQEFQELAEKVTQDLDMKSGIENLRKLYFVPKYRTDVTAEEFLQALNERD